MRLAEVGQSRFGCYYQFSPAASKRFYDDTARMHFTRAGSFRDKDGQDLLCDYLTLNKCPDHKVFESSEQTIILTGRQLGWYFDKFYNSTETRQPTGTMHTSSSFNSKQVLGEILQATNDNYPNEFKLIDEPHKAAQKQNDVTTSSDEERKVLPFKKSA